MGTNRTPLAYSAYTPGPLKYSSLTLRATGESASLKMRADKIIHPITKSEFFC